MFVPVRVVPSAQRLVNLMMGILPAAHRSRYGEEFSAELGELARARAGRFIQLLYAVQQLSRIWKLRDALRVSDRSRSRRLHRTACWVLASDARTWGPLAILMTWGGLDTLHDTGLGAAIFAVAGVGAVFQMAVTWARGHLGVKVRRRKKRID